MRRTLLFAMAMLQFLICHAQWQNSECTGGNSQVFLVDSLNFDNANKGVLTLIIDTTFSNNLWQVGAVQKNGFPSALSGVRTLQTDTVSAYGVNNESAAIVYCDSTIGGGKKEFSLIFWHYYDIDSTDSCILQVTIDSGKTWLNYADTSGSGVVVSAYYSGSLNNYGAQPYNNSVLSWSGASSGWVKEAVCISYTFAKGLHISRRYGFRFLFVSDSSNSNKPGWMIDDIRVKNPIIHAGVGDISKTQGVTVYPNPSSSGIYTIDYPSAYVNGSITFFDRYGRSVKTLPLQRQINVNDIPKGIYLYSILFNNTGQRFKGTLIYE
jgi:hypothetical protein